MKDCSAALRIPCLPIDAPSVPTPDEMLLALHPHQARALARCILIERDGSLSSDFGVSRHTSFGKEEQMAYASRGGVLADAVGMGKTAVALALALSTDEPGPNLVVAPSHLLHQWEHEARKFVKPGVMTLIVGADALAASSPSDLRGKRVLVLVDIAEVLDSSKLWYDFRRVFRERGGPALSVSAEKAELYRQCALFCVRSPVGPCSYTGWVYTGPLFLPAVPWRRVFLDEVQDLVQTGSVGHKCLMQLSRTARNVWLLSATPFPHGNESVYANHELLGFARLKLDIESERTLPYTHPFEAIKRKLYIRSPGGVREAAVTAVASATHQLKLIGNNQIERHFYAQERSELPAELASIEPGFGAPFEGLRQMCCHPEASGKLREAAGSGDGSSGGLRAFAVQTRTETRARIRALEDDVQTARDVLGVAERTLEFAREVCRMRVGANRANFLGGGSSVALSLDSVRQALHDKLCPGGETCAKRKMRTVLGEVSCGNVRARRVLTDEQRQHRQSELLQGGAKVDKYFLLEETLRGEDETNHFMSVTGTFVNSKQRALDAQQTELARLSQNHAELNAMLNGLSRDASSDAMMYGAKPAALLEHLRQIQAATPGAKVIVFSMWHDALRLVQRTLARNAMQTVMCEGSAVEMRDALARFCAPSVHGAAAQPTQEEGSTASSRKGAPVDVLLMSAVAKAAGANLQVATHVILLDPPGNSAAHGSTLEQQAIGRAVRMGQERAVSIVRFCLESTLERTLIEQIARASEREATRANDTNYTCESGDASVLRAAAIAPAPAAQDDELEIVLVRTAAGREAVKWAEAAEGGNIVALVDDSAEGDADVAEQQLGPLFSPTTERSADGGGSQSTAVVSVKAEKGCSTAPLDGELSTPPSVAAKSRSGGYVLKELSRGLNAAGLAAALTAEPQPIAFRLTTQGKRPYSMACSAKPTDLLTAQFEQFERERGWRGTGIYSVQGADGKRRAVHRHARLMDTGIAEGATVVAAEVVDIEL